jgi:hypothetical protein
MRFKLLFFIALLISLCGTAWTVYAQDETLGDQLENSKGSIISGWDLTVLSVSLSATTLPPNGDLTVTATVTNLGNQPSPAGTRIRVFRSLDAIIDTSDVIIDDDTLEKPLAPGLNFTQSANAKVPGAGGAGTWFIGVCIITSAGETNTTNNCSAGTEILVTGGITPPTDPPVSTDGWDLTVTNVTLSALTSPPNGELVVTPTATNISEHASQAQVRIRVYRSPDDIIDTSDFIIDDDTLEEPIVPV